ncbi:MAG TPA: hypothetical protein GX739_04695 [Firmicutes bacterium]|nr:hypothetical protein [Bacillota bacterium]
MKQKVVIATLIIGIVFGFSVLAWANGDYEFLPLEFVQEILAEEREWLVKTAITPDGAVATGSIANGRVVPYFANFGMIGLIDDPDYLPYAADWINWYFEHVNEVDLFGSPGTIYDYRLQGGKAISNDDYDSSDAYAGTFFTLCWKYIEQGGDTSIFEGRHDDFLLVASAIEYVWHNDLTWAKPNYKIKYLMDNIEVWKGLEALPKILISLYDDQENAAKYKDMAERVYNAIDKMMWLGDAFRMHLGKATVDWSVWYPDATAQVWPIWSGLLKEDDPRRDMIWERFNEFHPNWPELGFDSTFPWARVALAAAKMGDWERVDRYIRSVDNRFLQWGRRWPWHNSESGAFMETLEAYLDYRLEN